MARWLLTVLVTEAHARFADPKEALRHILGQERHRHPTPLGLSGTGPWGGATRMALSPVELHRHAHSRTDQFSMHVRGEAEGFSLNATGAPVLIPVPGGAHVHNAPDAPHGFGPKVGAPIPEDGEIVFIAITPRNLREDTQAVSPAVQAAYARITGRAPPVHL
jgi:hypothetical protein